MQGFTNNSYLLEEDVALWQEFSAGDEHAYESIYHKYAGELYRYAYMVVRDKSLAEDVIHDVFTDLWSHRAGIGKIRSLRLYLFSSVKRRALRKLKKERSFYDFELAATNPDYDITLSFLDELLEVQQREELTKKLQKGLAGLSNRQREIIYLRFYQNMPYDDIAHLLQLDQKYVYNLASKAFGVLRKNLPPLLLVQLLLLLVFS